VEALACGVPVAISRRINIWREIEADGAGSAVEPDTSAFSSVLKAWLSDDAATVNRRREAARACFERRFQSASAARNLLDVLKQNGVSGL